MESPLMASTQVTAGEFLVETVLLSASLLMRVEFVFLLFCFTFDFFTKLAFLSLL